MAAITLQLVRLRHLREVRRLYLLRHAKSSWDDYALRDPTGAFATLEADVTSWSELEPGGARLVSFVVPRELN